MRGTHRQHSEVGIGKEIFADRTLLPKEIEPRGALLALADRDRVEHRVDADQFLDVVLELVDVLDREADVVHAGRQDRGAEIVLDPPRHDHQRHLAVAQIMVGIARLGVLLGQFEHVDIEARHLVGPHGADRDVANVALVLLAGLVVDIDAGAVGHLPLRQVEDVAVRIVGGDPGERPGRGPLHIVGAGMLADALEHGLDLLDLDAEMIKPGRPPGLARIDVEADVAVADGDRAVGAGLRRGRHAEQRLVEGGEQRIFLADDGDVVDLGEHGRAPFKLSAAVQQPSYRPTPSHAKSATWPASTRTARKLITNTCPRSGTLSLSVCTSVWTTRPNTNTQPAITSTTVTLPSATRSTVSA